MPILYRHVHEIHSLFYNENRKPNYRIVLNHVSTPFNSRFIIITSSFFLVNEVISRYEITLDESGDGDDAIEADQ